MPPPADIVAAMEVIMEEIRSGAVSDDFFVKTRSLKAYYVPKTKWSGGELVFTKLGLSKPDPPNDIGYQISFGRLSSSKYTLYVDNPPDDSTVVRRAVLGGYGFMMTTHHTAYIMHHVEASNYMEV